MTEENDKKQEGEIKNSTLAIIAGVVVVLFIGGYFIFGGSSKGSNIAGNVVSPNGVVEVSTYLQGFQYNPDTITVKKGSTVRLTIDNRDNVNHGLHLMQFGVMDSIPALSQKTVEFTAIETPTNGQAVPTCSQEHGETLTINVV